jgi:hypothetical protein
VTLENYAKSLYLIVPAAVSPEAQALVAFLAEPAGEALLRRGGMIAGK